MSFITVRSVGITVNRLNLIIAVTHNSDFDGKKRYSRYAEISEEEEVEEEAESRQNL